MSDFKIVEYEAPEAAFNAKSVCPKCACDRVAAQHHHSKTFVAHVIYREPEHILRICGRCAFEWKERPIDAKDNA